MVAHVVEPFFTTKSLGAGSGLGLDMARRIAPEHGGKLPPTRAARSSRPGGRLPSPLVPTTVSSPVVDRRSPASCRLGPPLPQELIPAAAWQLNHLSSASYL
ncbi:HAMP domain-containing histidine kinase [Hymenobacter fodinae]|uniref:HAMP domain-containing histidine kinase n=1 Tax=Hymenobacter fodinae TaxID=2510796 RepID=A0A4Z0NYQ1_9BACT|nr:HAMP domain-containing histidine kinase [Hymenobacter fodinae]